jgi:hypothetical protein
MRRSALPLLALLLAACEKPVAAPAVPPAPAVQPAPAPKPGLLPMLPPEKEGDLPCDPKDRGPLLIGPATREKILAHREVFRTNTEKAVLDPAWQARWKAVDTPMAIVTGFGSWCGDTQREMPDMLALDALGNPFIQVHYFGVYRDKKAQDAWWPKDLPPQPLSHVPTFWLFAQQPGGGWKFVEAIVENPPRKGQRMAEAILEMVERAK